MMDPAKGDLFLSTPLGRCPEVEFGCDSAAPRTAWQVVPSAAQLFETASDATQQTDLDGWRYGALGFGPGTRDDACPTLWVQRF
jgi:hypothetical protein